jgi:hypothetical protein
LRKGLLFEIKILWGLKNKEYSQLRKSWDTPQQCLGRKRPLEVVKEKERDRCSPKEKL